MPGKRGELTAKQRRFVETYLSNGQNAAAAYRAVYSKGTSPQRVAEAASKLLRNSKIAPIIASAIAKADAAVARAADRFAVTKERLVREMAILAHVRMDDIICADGKIDLAKLAPESWAAVRKVEFDPETGALKRFELYDKRAAGETLARLLGWITEKHDYRVIKSLEDLTDEELETLHQDANRLAPEGTRH